MSGRGGIYKGPNGEQLYGDGREVNKPAEPSPEVAPMQQTCQYCKACIKRTGSGRWRTQPPNSFFCESSPNGSHSPPAPPIAKCPKCGGEGHRGGPDVFWHYLNEKWMGQECPGAAPAVAPRETQTVPNAELLANDIMKIVTRGWDPQGKVPVANYNRIFAEVYTLLLRIRAERGR